MRYLSPAWFAAAHQALADASEPAPATVTIDQHVEAHAAWRITLDPSGSTIAPFDNDHPTEPADVVFHQSWATACAIAKGESDAHQAFLLGDIRFEGSVERLIESRASLEWLARQLAPTMRATIFD